MSGIRAGLVSLTAIAFAAASLWLGTGPIGLCGAMLALIMVAIADSDQRDGLIPDALNAAGVVTGLVHAALVDAGAPLPGVGDATIRAVVAAGALWLIRELYLRMRGQDGLGLGDVKLVCVAGIWLDWLTIVFAIEIAAICAIAVHGIAALARRGTLEASHELPFGLYLAPAIWLGWAAQTLGWTIGGWPI